MARDAPKEGLVVIYTGFKVVFGIPKEIKPITNAPEGRQRFRFRSKQPARLYVKTQNGIKGFYIIDKEDHLEVGAILMFGLNTTADNT